MATPRKYTLERLNSALENYNRTILRLSGQGLTLPLFAVEVQKTLYNLTKGDRSSCKV